MSFILLIDSVHTELAVALIGDNCERKIAGVVGNFAKFKIHKVQKAHDKNINKLVSEVLAEAGVSFDDLEAYAVVVGPGSWTGCRVGVAAVKGFAAAVSKPVVAINSLDAIGDPSAIRSNLDNFYIKRGNKYSCEKLVSTDGFATIESIGIENYRSRLVSLAKSGKRVDACQVQPFYLTDFVVKS